MKLTALIVVGDTDEALTCLNDEGLADYVIQLFKHPVIVGFIVILRMPDSLYKRYKDRVTLN